MNKRVRAAVAEQRHEVGVLKEAGEPFQAALAKLLALEQEMRGAQRARSVAVSKDAMEEALVMDPTYPLPREIPTDSDGFTVGFAVVEASGAASSFLKEWGFVVFDNVLNKAECEATVAEIWGQLEETNMGLDRSNLETYDTLRLVHGLSPVTPQYTPQVVQNRQNARLVAAFSGLLGCGTDEYLVSQDRWCLYRPTVPPPKLNSPEAKNEADFDPELVAKMASWRTDTRLHLDMHPWKYLAGGTAADSLRYDDSRDFSREVSFVEVSFVPFPINPVALWPYNLDSNAVTMPLTLPRIEGLRRTPPSGCDQFRRQPGIRWRHTNRARVPQLF